MAPSSVKKALLLLLLLSLLLLCQVYKAAAFVRVSSNGDPNKLPPRSLVPLFQPSSTRSTIAAVDLKLFRSRIESVYKAWRRRRRKVKDEKLQSLEQVNVNSETENRVPRQVLPTQKEKALNVEIQSSTPWLQEEAIEVDVSNLAANPIRYHETAYNTSAVDFMTIKDTDRRSIPTVAVKEQIEGVSDNSPIRKIKGWSESPDSFNLVKSSALNGHILQENEKSWTNLEPRRPLGAKSNSTDYDAENCLAATVKHPTSALVLQSPPATSSLKSLYSLPPANRSAMTPLEAEFRDMLEYFCQFTQADLYTIRDPRVRTIMEGVISSSDEPAVYRAFEVLFEDLPPLRVAGRLIYGRLKHILQDAALCGQAEVALLVETTELSVEHVELSRLAFLTLAAATEYGRDDEAHLTLQQLVDSGLADTAMSLLGFDNQVDFLSRLDQQSSGRVTFPEFMVGLQAIAKEVCATERCDPAMVLQTVASEMEPVLASSKVKLDKRRQEFSDRYDMMVEAFQSWDDVVPKGDGRRLDVLRGCFVGARNKRVVEALRVVYIDYAALRLAGNSIFALTKSLVTQLRKRSNSNL